MENSQFPAAKVDWVKFYEIINKGGPVAISIVGASVLDELLRRLIVHFAQNRTLGKKLVNKDGPANTLRNKILLSYSLGLITKDEYNNLESIRNIRNEFAHSLGKSNYDDNTIISYCNKLTMHGDLQFVQALSGHERLKYILVSMSAKLALRQTVIKSQSKFEKYIENYMADTKASIGK